MPQHPSSLSGVFGKPFAEQVAFFRRKLGRQVPTRRWDDLQGAAHDDAFMVAGAAKADLLSDLAAAIDKAIAEGRGIEEFRRDFRAIVAKNGWTGWAGEGSVKGEAWRVGVILRTNAYTSYAAGRLAQLRQGNFAYWVYRHGGSLEPRPAHLSWNGWAGPPSHPFWITHYPPSDWGCSCYVVGARTLAGVRRLGGDPDKALPANWQQRDPKTGAPVGIGKGWDYAPGASVAPIISAMANKIGAWDYQIAKAFMGDLPDAQADALANSYRALPSTKDDARRYAERVYEPNPDLPELAPMRTMGRVTSDQAGEIEQLTGLPVGGYDFSFDPSAVRHVIRFHGDDAAERLRGQRGVTSADWARLPLVLAHPDQVRASGTSDMGEQLIAFERVIGGETFVAEMAIRGAKRRTLALKTMYIRIGKKG
ncbi:MAG: phage head protein [Sphingomonadales bacterium]|nr:phage head protein [Sphingomonadales bacterium]